jgi:PadR family transcriptional regulator PadR
LNEKVGPSQENGLNRGSEPIHSLALALLQQVVLLVEVKGRGIFLTQHIDPPKGALELLIHRTIALGPQHGWAFSERVRKVSCNVLRIQQGSVHPTLHRLERRGLINAHWGTSGNNPRAKFYEPTRTGRHQFDADQKAWDKLAAAAAQVLRAV